MQQSFSSTHLNHPIGSEEELEPILLDNSLLIADESNRTFELTLGKGDRELHECLAWSIELNRLLLLNSWPEGESVTHAKSKQ